MLLAANPMRTDSCFTEAQQAQLKLAAECGVKNTECRNHPEWGPTLMNLFWNRERKHSPLQPVFDTAEYLSIWFPKVNGVLYDEALVLFYIVQTFEQKRLPIVPHKDANGDIDTDMFLFRAKEDWILANGSFRLYSGRVSINDADWLDTQVLMAEGRREVDEIISALQARAVLARDFDGRYYEMPAGIKRTATMTNILLTLDDMNIRGYQILYAMEYAGGSIELLYSTVRGSSPEKLCRFINRKSAIDYLAGNVNHNQIAVAHGASFCHSGTLSSYISSKLNMTNEQAKVYASDTIEPLEPKWGTLDIVGKISSTAAKQIMAAHGFQLLRKTIHENKFHESTPVFDMLFYNPATKDYIQAPDCYEYDICYGGVRLYMHRDFQNAGFETRSWLCNASPHEGQSGTAVRFSQQEGLFRNFEKSKRYLPETDFDWMKIGFGGTYGIPVPAYFEMPFLHPDDMREALPPELCCVMSNMGEVNFKSLVNHILCLYDEDLRDSVSPHYKLYRDWFCNGGLRSCIGWSRGFEHGASVVCAAVLKWLKVPEQDVVSYMANQEEYADYQERASKLDADNTKYIAAAYRLPDPATLPIKLPWFANAN